MRSIISALTLFAFGARAALAQAPVAPPAMSDTTAVNPRAAQPERPTVATHAGTVAKGYVEFEVGLENDNGPRHASNHITTIVTKIGVGRRAQLSFAVNGSAPDGGRTGFGDLGAGLKLRIVDDHPWLGDFAVQPSLKFPTGSRSRGTGTGTTDASVLLISSRDVGPVHIDLNAGYTARSGDGSDAPTTAFVWTASFGGTIAGKAGWTAEVFGYPGMGGSAPIAGLLFGPTLAVYDWLVFDIGTIVPLTNAQPRAVYLGATFNVGKVF